MKEPKQLPYVCLYRDNLEAFRKLSYQAVGKLVMAMLIYLETGEEPDFKGVLQVLWPGIRRKMLRDRDAYALRCEQNRKNGSKGGRPKRNPTETDGITSEPEKANKNNNQNHNDNNNQNHNNNRNKKKNESESESQNWDEVIGAPAPDFLKPSVTDIMGYCIENGICIDPEAFYDHYEATGWMLGASPMRNWKAAVRSWASKTDQYGF